MKFNIRKIIAITAAVLLVALLVIAGISYSSSRKLISPPREAITVTPDELGIGYEEIRYQTPDGITIRGWFIPASTSAANPNSHDTIILAHGYTHNRAQMNDYMKFLYARGFNTLSFDFRGHGESGGDFTTVGANEPKDIDGAVTWLKSNHPKESEKIGLLGISMGGGTSIIATANNKSIDALVTDSAFAKLSNAVDSSFAHFAHLPAFPFSPVTIEMAQIETHADISKVLPVQNIHSISPRPVFIIHSKLDTVILYNKNAVPLYETAGEPKQLWLVEGGEHVENLSFAGGEYENKVSKFFEESLNPKAVSKPVSPADAKPATTKKK